MSFLTGIWGKLLAALAVVGGILLIMLKLIGLGKSEEKAKEQAKAAETQKRMDDANQAGAHTADDVDNDLKSGKF